MFASTFQKETPVDCLSCVFRTVNFRIVRYFFLYKTSGHVAVRSEKKFIHVVKTRTATWTATWTCQRKFFLGRISLKNYVRPVKQPIQMLLALLEVSSPLPEKSFLDINKSPCCIDSKNITSVLHLGKAAPQTIWTIYFYIQ